MTTLREIATSFEGSWEHTVALWKESCPGLDDILEEYARSLGGELEKWLEDTPSRVLSWHEQDIAYAISMLVREGRKPLLDVWVAAWRDDEENLIRHALGPDEPRTWNTPVTPVDIGSYLDAATAELRTEVDSGKWTQESTLPPRPGNALIR